MALDTVTEPGLNAPGASLKAAREKAGRSLEDVSRDTHITVSRLRALEDDDYKRVGNHIFVVGYIRQYAKWLGLPADDLVRAFEEQTGAGEAPEAVAVPPAEPKARPRLPLLWLVVVLLVVWVIAAIMLSGEGEPGGEASEQASPSAPEQAVQPTVEPDANIDMEASAPDPAPMEETSDIEAEADSPVADEAEGAAPAGLESEATVAEEAADLAATDMLTMSFAGECWVEVRDANGQLLFAQLQQAGDNLRLLGQAPFSLVLGNARAATVEVNGRPVETDPGPNRNTLRLKAGP